MGKFQTMRKYFVVFLALVACNESLLSHGRPIKPLNQQHSSLNTDPVASEVKPQTPLPPLKTNVNNVPTPSSKKKVDSTMMPNYEVVSFEDSDEPYTNAFRPTTPGGSPGVGHKKFIGEDNNMKAMVVVQSPDVKLSVTEGSKDDFKPAGHSPGVGHAYQNKIGHLN